MFEFFNGPHDVLFVGKTEYARINVKYISQGSGGEILWVEDNSGAIYNWANILVMRKARG